MKKNKTIVIVLCCLAVLLISAGALFLNDRQKFISEDKNLNQYVYGIKGESRDISISEERYCSYGHQKYSKGNLGCQVGYVLQDNSGTARGSSITKYLEQSLGWQYKGDNTSSVNAYSTQKYTAHKVFSHGSLSCIFSSSDDVAITTYKVSCYGPAKAEWFPVRNS